MNKLEEFGMIKKNYGIFRLLILSQCLQNNRILKKQKAIGGNTMKKRLKKVSNYESFDDWVADVVSQEPNGADAYMKMAFEEFIKDGNEKALLITLRQVAKAKGGFIQLADKTGLSRESLYKTLSPQGNPRLHTLTVILNALGYKLQLQHQHHSHGHL